ncbi:MucBP domain-containing protein [Vagococcus fluvialis]|uniref:Prealbumin-like fold domain-containing protein n=1 Tax=Vagococcus fluvialis TaxID=2738 RepID=A0A7X6I3U9_9ENTE|nr:MucBP domain-containing protein [Vagococcus fluvialis]NKC68199.1 hypothetical protein [Vagococcus fluvialis]
MNLIDQEGNLISSHTQEGISGKNMTVTVQTPQGYTATSQLTQTQLVTDATKFNFYFKKDTPMEPEKTFE